jgi:hypothetical protein
VLFHIHVIKIHGMHIIYFKKNTFSEDIHKFKKNYSLNSVLGIEKLYLM